MANTTRENLLNNIKATLEGVTSIKYVEIDRMQAPDYATTPFPCAFIYSGAETRVEGIIGRETWSSLFYIEIWTSGGNIEQFLGLVHTAMHSDYKRGEYATDSYRTGVDFFYIDPTRDLKGCLIEYTVIYDHISGAP